MTDSTDILSNFCTAFYSKFTAVDGGGANNAFYTSINGRFFEDEAEAGTPFPYAVYSIVTAPKQWNFKNVLTDILLQISIFSSNIDAREIQDIYQHASDLYNDAVLSITGATLAMIYEENMTPILEEHTTTTEGTTRVRHYAIDFRITTEPTT